MSHKSESKDSKLTTKGFYFINFILLYNFTELRGGFPHKKLQFRSFHFYDGD
jgi:hypothetical protein